MAKKSPQDIKAEAAELSDLVTRMRKKSHNFALTIGKEGGVVLAADPKKSASVMWRQAKAGGGTSKGCMGVASVKGKVIQFFPEGGEEPPRTLLLNTKKHLKDLNLAFKAVFILGDGAVVGEEGGDVDTSSPNVEAADPEDDMPLDARAAEDQDEGEADTRVATLKQQIKDLSPEVEALAQSGHRAAGKLVSALELASDALEAEQIDKAEATTAKIASALETIGGAANQDANDPAQDAAVEARNKLETAFGRISPKLDQLKDAGSDKVARKADQMTTMFWQTLDAGDWKKAANSAKAAKAFADKELPLLAAFPAPTGEPASKQTRAAPTTEPASSQARDAELLTLDADVPEQAARLMQEDLTARDPSEVFDPDHMVELSQMEFEYAGDATLRALMPRIEAGLSAGERDMVITQLANIVGADKDRLDADYDRYRVLLEQQQAFGTKKHKEEVPDLEDDTFPDFRASPEQLLFGAVLGEVFGIHEVFAALLSPTGGLVGPGNDLIPGVRDAEHLGDRNAIGLHGIFHDAAGYLTSYHDEGPGYNYLESDDEFLDTGNPLCGQVSGIEFWVEQTQAEDAQAAAEFVEGVAQRVDAQVLIMERQLEGARDQTADAIDDCLAQYEALKTEAGAWTGWMPPSATAPVEFASDAAVYGAAGAVEFGVDAVTRVAEAGAHIDAAGANIEAELAQHGTEFEASIEDLGVAGLGHLSDVAEVFTDSGTDALGALSDGADGVVDAVSQARGDIANIAANAGGEIAGTAARTSQRLGAASGPLDAADALGDAAVDMAGTVARAAAGTTGEALEAVGEIGANVVDTRLDLVREAAELSSGINRARAATTAEVAGIVADAVGDAFETAVDIGDAVGDALGGVADAAGGLVDDITDNPITEAVADTLSGWASSFGW